MIKLFAYLFGLGLIWSVAICLLRHESIMKDSEDEK